MKKKKREEKRFIGSAGREEKMGKETARPADPSKRGNQCSLSVLHEGKKNGGRKKKKGRVTALSAPGKKGEGGGRGGAPFRAAVKKKGKV